ncbi:MAG: HAD-IIIA family hydrolase [Nanoarchaeota archaeon]
MKIAVFIDRDGVINKEIKQTKIKDNEGRSCSDPLCAEDLIFFEGVKEAFKLMKEENFLRIIVSNQAGFAKGFFNKDVLNEVKEKLQNELEPTQIYYCLHHEDYTGPCECKKPKKGMLFEAMRDHDIDLSSSYMIGDRRNDMKFGDQCKKCFYIDTRKGEIAKEEVAKLNPELQKKVIIVNSLLEAVKIIIKENNYQKK